MFGEGPGELFKRSYTIHIRFTDAPGVRSDTPVKKSGVLIGRVSNVELLDEGGVLVTARIDGDKAVRAQRSRSDLDVAAGRLGDHVCRFGQA